jgi:hypothetical protein
MYFDAAVPHSYRRVGRTTCSAPGTPGWPLGTLRVVAAVQKPEEPHSHPRSSSCG